MRRLPQIKLSDKRTLTPEQNLLTALLEKAIRDCISAPNRAQRESLKWIFDDAHHDCFSFLGACDYLNFSAENIRAELRRWIKTRRLEQAAGLPWGKLQAGIGKCLAELNN